MLVEARKLALEPKATPVACAVWSFKTFSSVHFLQRYTLKKVDKITLTAKIE